MATSLAFGILFATAITLFLIPALYLALDGLGNWWTNAWQHVLPEKLTQPDTGTRHIKVHSNATGSSEKV
jgi:hypothetical protein